MIRPRVSKKAYNRWMVAYTLLRNPSLQELTASNLKDVKTADSKPADLKETIAFKDNADIP